MRKLWSIAKKVLPALLTLCAIVSAEVLAARYGQFALLAVNIWLSSGATTAIVLGTTWENWSKVPPPQGQLIVTIAIGPVNALVFLVIRFLIAPETRLIRREPKPDWSTLSGSMESWFKR